MARLFLFSKSYSFTAPSDIEKGLPSSAVNFQLVVTNDQTKMAGSGSDNNNPCQKDYKVLLYSKESFKNREQKYYPLNNYVFQGQVLLKDNFFGAVERRNLKLEGATKIQIMDNHFDSIQAEGIEILNAKETHFKMNNFRYW